MRRLPLKLHNDRGETLIEVLVSILIAALSVTMLFSCVMASSTIGQSAKNVDIAHYSALSDAEAYTTPTPDPDSTPTPSRNVTITGEDVVETLPIDIYGGEGMFSYRRQS